MSIGSLKQWLVRANSNQPTDVRLPPHSTASAISKLLDRARRSTRQDKTKSAISKFLKLLALPRGLEPLFSP